MMTIDRKKTEYAPIEQSYLLNQNEIFDKKPPNQSLIVFSLAIIDIVGVLGSFWAGLTIRIGHHSSSADYFYNGGLFGLAIVLFLFLYVFDLYNLESQISGLRAPGRLLLAAMFAGLSYISFVFIFGGKGLLTDSVGRGILGLTLAFFTLWGACWRITMAWWLRKKSNGLRWLVLTHNADIQRIEKDFSDKPSQRKLYFLVPQFYFNKFKTDDLPVLGTWNDFDETLKEPWSGIVIEDGTKLPDNFRKKLMNARLQGMRIYNLSNFYERVLFKIPVYHVQDGWFTLSNGFDLLHNPIGLRIKRLSDLVLSAVLFSITLPLMFFTTILIRLTSRGPAVYKQIRTGEGGKPFIIYKFRSMVINAEDNGAQWASKNDSRITFIGKIIRKTRIDELPQLLNVLKGEMSFIGPRPERPEMNEQLSKAIPYYNLRHLMKPGITGWAQVFYSYGASLEDSMEKLQYELYYIKNCSFILDFAIILKTLRVVLFGRGR